MAAGEYSVAQWFPDDTYEYVRRWVDIEEAMSAAHHYMTCVGARMGTTTQVMITDGGDCCIFLWKNGEGVVWPEQQSDGHYAYPEEA